MGWLGRTMDRLKDATTPEPVECPRGWGLVSFSPKVDVAWPWWVSLTHKCPIGNVDACVNCLHPYNPTEIDALAARLTELDALGNEIGLSADELTYRRRLILQMRDGTPSRPGQGLRVTAWILGPLGTLLVAAGAILARTVDASFWFIALGGAVMLVLTVSFAAIASMQAGEEDDS